MDHQAAVQDPRHVNELKRCLYREMGHSSFTMLLNIHEILQEVVISCGAARFGSSSLHE